MTSLTDEDRAAGAPRDGVAAALALAREQLDMELAVLGAVVDGREVVRAVDGDGESFGLAPGASLPLASTYCQQVLDGRLSGVVADAAADERVRDLELTELARIGAYIGVPLTGEDARLYMLCCLAHESRPALGEADLRFLRGVGETVLAALERGG
jgi:GAF domain-containing protein